MRISQQTEWALVAVLVLYIAFTPGFPVVRQFLSTGVGKAIGLAVIVAAWKYLSPLVALLLLVNFVRCASMREYADDASMKPAEPSPPSPCPENSELKDGQCRNKTTGQSTPVSPMPSPSAAAPPPATAPPPPSISSTTTKMPVVAEGFRPNEKDDKYAPA